MNSGIRATATDREQRLCAATVIRILAVPWLLCWSILLVYDGRAAAISGTIAGVTLGILGFARWTLPPPVAESADLVQQGSRWQLRARGLVIAGLLTWCYVYAAAVNFRLPGANALIEELYRIPTGLPRGGIAPMTTLTMVLIPLAVLTMLGTTPRQLGLLWATGGVARLACWLALPILLLALRLGSGYLSLIGLLKILVENALLNGVPEEFVFRGALLSMLRRLVPLSWAMAVQATAFALFHYFVTMNEIHGGKPIIIVADAFAENAQIGVILGLMATRSGSLMMPATIHWLLDSALKSG